MILSQHEIQPCSTQCSTVNTQCYHEKLPPRCRLCMQKTLICFEIFCPLKSHTLVESSWTQFYKCLKLLFFKCFVIYKQKTKKLVQSKSSEEIFLVSVGRYLIYTLCKQNNSVQSNFSVSKICFVPRQNILVLIFCLKGQIRILVSF